MRMAMTIDKKLTGRAGLLAAALLAGCGLRLEAAGPGGIVRVQAGFDRMIADAGQTSTSPEMEKWAGRAVEEEKVI